MVPLWASVYKFLSGAACVQICWVLSELVSSGCPAGARLPVIHCRIRVGTRQADPALSYSWILCINWNSRLSTLPLQIRHMARKILVYFRRSRCCVAPMVQICHQNIQKPNPMTDEYTGVVRNALAFVFTRVKNNFLRQWWAKFNLYFFERRNWICIDVSLDWWHTRQKN